MKAAAVRRRQFLLTVMSGVYIAVSVAVAIFDFVLMLQGGWDDVSMFMCLLSPASAFIAFMLAAMNVAKYRARRFWLAPPLCAVAFSGVFFCVAAIGISITTTQKYMPAEVEATATHRYSCSFDEDGVDTVGIIMNSDRDWKIFDLNNLDSYVSGSYGFSENGEKIYIMISDSLLNEDERFETTEFEFVQEAKTKFVAKDFSLYCSEE